ncbi:MAG: O-antigen ligase family protein, partial [Oscillospiraceae bacterium]
MSNINKSLTNGVKSRLASCTKPQLVLGLATASIFMPFLITCVMLVITVLYAVFNKDTRRKMFADRSNLPIYIFSILLLAVPLLYGRYFSAFAGFGFLVTLLFFLFAKSIMDKSFYNILMDICCGASTICFLYSVVQKMMLGSEFRTTGGLLNANYYGTICELVIIIAVYRALTNKKYRGIYFTIAAMNVAGIFLCDCQSAWIAVMAGVIGLLVFSGHKKQGFIFLIVSIILVVIGLFTPGLLPRMDVMPQTFTTRMNIWTTAFQGIKAHWLFGQGTLTYLFIYKLYDGYKTYHAHSLYLD